MELTRLKRKLVTARRGHKLLKDKRDELMRQFLGEVRNNKELREKVEKGIAASNKNFALARSGMSDEAVRVAFMSPKQEVVLSTATRNVMSVEVPVYTYSTRTSDPNDIYSYGFAFTSSDLDDAVTSLAELLPDMLRLAESEKTCQLLAAEIEKTRRRVNALEHVMIPEMEADIRYISMKLDESFTMIFLGGMTVLSAAFYPIVPKLVKKFGKKKLVITGFLGLALAYVVAGLIGVIGTDLIPGIIYGVLICVIAAFPMALLGIIPQSIVADVAEADGYETGENREGMFFAARTFAMKFGQSLAMLVFTSLAIIGTTQNANSNDITASVTGMTFVGFVAVAFCSLGAILLGFYNEKKVMDTIEENHKK